MNRLRVVEREKAALEVSRVGCLLVHLLVLRDLLSRTRNARLRTSCETQTS
jgi:hypothetical protein